MRNSSTGALPVILLFLAAMTSLACQSESKERLLIAVQPSSNPEALASESREIESFLEQRLDGVDVEIRVPTLYAGTIEALRFGNAHAAFMSAWPAALANKHAGADVALAEVREVIIAEERQEQPFYFSYWVVLKDSSYGSLQDLKGKRAAFPSPLSTSGFVTPMARLVELGMVTPGDREVDPKQFFGEVIFAGGYAQAWEALKRGQVDVTVIAGDVPESLYRDVLAATRVLEQQGPIPSHAVVFSKELKDPLRLRLKNALIELGQPDNRALMRKFISGIFMNFKETSTQEHLSPLIKSLESTRLQYTEGLK